MQLSFPPSSFDLCVCGGGRACGLTLMRPSQRRGGNKGSPGPPPSTPGQRESETLLFLGSPNDIQSPIPIREGEPLIWLVSLSHLASISITHISPCQESLKLVAHLSMYIYGYGLRANSSGQGKDVRRKTWLSKDLEATLSKQEALSIETLTIL